MAEGKKTGVTFRRINGRIVPIKRDSNHGKMALLGAAAVPLALGQLASKKHGLKFGLAGSALSFGTVAYSLNDSFNHGSERGSFLHGVGRYATNSAAWAGGAFLAAGALSGQFIKVMKSSKNLRKAIRNLN